MQTEPLVQSATSQKRGGNISAQRRHGCQRKDEDGVQAPDQPVPGQNRHHGESGSYLLIVFVFM